jgi:hypothetical protein
MVAGPAGSTNQLVHHQQQQQQQQQYNNDMLGHDPLFNQQQQQQQTGKPAGTITGMLADFSRALGIKSFFFYFYLPIGNVVCRRLLFFYDGT